MDYEKKYKDALRWIKDVYPTFEGAVKEDAEHFFPELKESEDEEIRKNLITFFKDEYGKNSNARFTGIKVKDIIAWLEKQGEQKPLVIDEGKAEMDYCFTKMMNGEKVSPTLGEEDEEYNGEDYGIDSLYHAQRILEKTLGEVEGYQSDDGILEHKCAITAVKKLYKYKPKEWSEEDETALCDALWCCKQSRTIAKDENDMGNIWYAEKWLKSLKDRVQPQWKPSDEQMAHLVAAIEESDGNCILQSLYNDLKKL